jgi:methyl-accepting chemotaxis protein
MKKIGLGLKIMFFTFLLLVITAGILIYFSYQTSKTDLEVSIGQRLESIASTGALMIDGDLHRQITSMADVKGEAFLKLQEVLRKIKKANNLKEELYTFQRKGDKLHYVVMSHEGTPFVGDTYQIREEMWPALNEGKPSHTKIFRDEHGIWMSAYAPIYDSSGSIAGILDVDIKLMEFQQELSKKVNRLITISVILMMVAIILSFLLSRGLVKKLRYLSDITQKISTGMMDRSISIKSKDEVGELAASLERMRVSLKMAMEMIAENEDHEEDEQ